MRELANINEDFRDSQSEKVGGFEDLCDAHTRDSSGLNNTIDLV